MSSTTWKPQFVTDEGIGYDLDPYQKPVKAKLVDNRECVFNGHEHLLRVEIAETNNAIPGSEDWKEIIAGGRVRIWSDDYQVYTFRFTSIEVALAKLVQVLDRLKNFPIPLRNRKDCEAMTGRKIYWREYPAVITDFDGSTGTLYINSDNVRRKFKSAPWEEELYFVNAREDLLSPQVYWFREESE